MSRKVYNHFRQPIEVYHMTDKGNELKFISSVPAEGHINVPVPAVYTQTNELFFAVPNFSVSTTPYVWKDLQNNLVVTKLLQCPPRSPESGSQNYIIKAMGEMQQVYMESTNKHTMVSNCYNIHLRPVIEFTNCLPVDIILNLESRSDEYEIKAGHTWNLRFAIPGKSALIIRVRVLIINSEDSFQCCLFVDPQLLGEGVGVQERNTGGAGGVCCVDVHQSRQSKVDEHCLGCALH